MKRENISQLIRDIEAGIDFRSGSSIKINIRPPVKCVRPGGAGMLQVVFSLFVSLSFFLLVGCGGSSMQSELQSKSYSKPAGEIQNYHPHSSFSHMYQWYGYTYIGSDVAPREKLRTIGKVGEFKYYMGASRDGVGVDRIENYEQDLKTKNGTTFSLDGFYPFRVKPKIWFNPEFVNRLSANEPDALSVYGVVRSAMNILNDALPPEFQIELARPNAGDSPTQEGALFVKVVPGTDIARECGSDAAACSGVISQGYYPFGHIKQSNIVISADMDTSNYSASHTIVVHELLHALGIRGHVDSVEFPDSLMGTRGDYFPNPGYVLHRIDREVLQIMYMSQRTDDYNDFGEWSDTTLHLVGEIADYGDEGLAFGVALFNGLPQPWARGETPATSILERPLRGTVNWTGALLGFSGPSPVVGNTELVIDMNDLKSAHALMFSDLTYFNRSEESGPEKYFHDRDIDYKVHITADGLGFVHSSDKGIVTGGFFGHNFGGMAGTLKRTDLVGAFGGTRW